METSQFSEDIRHYLALAWHWAWLLALGLLIGAASAFWFSYRQAPVYQASTKFMLSRAPEDASNYYNYYNDQQTLKTYLQVLLSAPVLQETSRIVGDSVHAGQITGSILQDTTILRLNVTDTDPDRAARIANTLIDVLIAYNSSIQRDRFSSSEESLQAQIKQVESQIANVQAQMEQTSEASLKTQQEQVEARMEELKGEISALKVEIATLTVTANQAANPENSAQATLTALQQANLQEKQGELAERESMLDLYKQISVNLAVYGQAEAGGSRTTQNNQMQTTLMLYQQIYSNLLSSYENVRLARLKSTPNLVQIEPALVPQYPIRPQPQKDALLGGAVGLILIGAIVFLIEYLDDTLRSPAEITRQFGVPVLGIIARHPAEEGRLVTVDQPRSPVSEAFRSLRTNLQYSSIDAPLRTLLVTSPSPSDGKTTITSNLGVVMAQSGLNVVVIDADLRKPKVHRALGLQNWRGLSFLFVQQPLHANGSLQKTDVTSLRVLTSGSLPPNPAELLGSSKMLDIVKHVGEDADLVILDSPPLLAVTDAAVLAPRVDGILLVVKPGETKLGALREAIEQLQRVGGNLLGVVLNEVDFKSSRYKYSYYKSYQYKYSGYYGSENGAGKPDKQLEDAVRKEDKELVKK